MSEKLLNRRRSWIIGGVAGVLVVGGGVAIGTAAFADDGDDGSDSGATSQVADEDDYAPATAPDVALSDAIATAADEVKNGVMTSVELHGDDDAPVWSVEFVTSDGTEHDVRVNATDGTVSDHNKESEDDDDDWSEAKALNDKAKTAPEDAAATALDKAGKGTVTSVELDDDGDTPRWDVDVTTKDGSEKEYSIDATNGKVTATDTDDDDGDDDSDDDAGDDNDDD